MKKIIIPILTILLISTILVAVKATNEGSKLLTLEKRAAELEEENKELKNQIISKTSLTEIGKNADKLGLGKPEKFIYLTNSGIALR